MKYLFILFLSALLLSCSEKKSEASKEKPEVEVDKVWVISEELSKINDSEMRKVFYNVGRYSTNIKSGGYDAFVFDMLLYESHRKFVYDIMKAIYYDRDEVGSYKSFFEGLGLGPVLTDLPEGTLHKQNCKHVVYSKVPVKTMHALSTIGYLFSYCKDCFPDTYYYRPSFHDDVDWGHDESYRGQSVSDINDVIRRIDFLLRFEDFEDFNDELNIMKLLLNDAKDNLECVEQDFPNVEYDD